MNKTQELLLNAYNSQPILSGLNLNLFVASREQWIDYFYSLPEEVQRTYITMGWYDVSHRDQRPGTYRHPAGQVGIRALSYKGIPVVERHAYDVMLDGFPPRKEWKVVQI